MNTGFFKQRQTSMRLNPNPAADKHPLARVLVVEDDPLSQETLKKQLTDLGCAVEMASDAPEAMSNLQRKAFDVILITCDSPVIDVFETIGSIRREGDESVGGVGDPVVAIGMMANRGRITRQRFLAAGFHDCLLRPLNPERLGQAVARGGADVIKTAGEVDETPKPRFAVPNLVTDHEAVIMTAS